MPASEQQKINAVVPLLQRLSVRENLLLPSTFVPAGEHGKHTAANIPGDMNLLLSRLQRTSTRNWQRSGSAYSTGTTSSSYPPRGLLYAQEVNGPPLNRISSPRADKKEKSHADPPGPPSFHLDLSSPIASNPVFPPHNKVQGGETKTEHETHGGHR